MKAYQGGIRICVNTSFQDDKICVNKDALQHIADNVTSVNLIKGDEVLRHTQPRPCFTTSTLQQTASSVLNFKPDKTMQLCQKLFENGLITYHRTDSPNLSSERYDDMSAYLQNNGVIVREKAAKYKASAGSQEAHEAISPTDFSIKKLSKEFKDAENRLYQLIYERTTLSAMPDAVDAVITLTASATFEDKDLKFECSETVIKDDGWREFALIEPVKRKDSIKLPSDLNDTYQVNSDDYEIITKTTKAPSRFTEASLIKALEKLEIGRPATYANIVKSLFDRGYVKLNKRYIEITELGSKVVIALKQQQFMNLSFTQQLESKLDDITKGDETYHSIVSQVYDILDKEKAKIKFN